MYNNLIQEIVHNKIPIEYIADLISTTPKKFKRMLIGEKDFRILECKIIIRTFFPNLTINYLFKKN